MKATDLSKIYHGRIARNYDEERERTTLWHKTQTIIESLLEKIITKDTILLDVPIGTGRFIATYERLGCTVLGVDISDEMLEIAAKKISSNKITLKCGDVFNLNFTANVVLCVGFLYLLNFADVCKTIANIVSVHPKHIIVTDTIRGLYKTPKTQSDSDVRKKENLIEDTITLVKERGIFYVVKKTPNFIITKITKPTVHNHDRLIAEFGKYGYTVAYQTCVEKIGKTDYNVYHFTK